LISIFATSTTPTAAAALFVGNDREAMLSTPKTLNAVVAAAVDLFNEQQMKKGSRLFVCCGVRSSDCRRPQQYSRISSSWCLSHRHLCSHCLPRRSASSDSVAIWSVTAVWRRISCGIHVLLTSCHFASSTTTTNSSNILRLTATSVIVMIVGC